MKQHRLRVFENRVLGHMARTGERKNAYVIFVGEYEERIPFVKDTRKWEDNIKINHTRKKWGKWTGLTCSWIRTNSGLLLTR